MCHVISTHREARTESIEAKLDKLLAAAAAGALGAATPDTATYHVADFAAKPAFFQAFWSDYFPSNAPVAFDEFASVFAADFCPLEVCREMAWHIRWRAWHIRI